MLLKIQDIPPEGLDIDERIPAGGLPLGSDVSLEGELEVHLHAAPVKGLTLLSGTLKGTVRMQCRRCLQDVFQRIETSFHAEYAPLAFMDKEEEVQLALQDMDLDFYEGDTLDLDDLFREQVLLALPYTVLCRSDCRGLCPTCGQNLNAGSCRCAPPAWESPWAKLAALRNDKGKPHGLSH